MPATVPLNSILKFLSLEHIASVKQAHGKQYNYIINPIINKRKKALKAFSKTKIPLKTIKKFKDQKWKRNNPNVTGYGRNNYRFHKNILGSIRQVGPFLKNENKVKALRNGVIRNMKPYPKNYSINNHPNNYAKITNHNIKIGNNIVRAGKQRNYESGYKAAYVEIYIKQPNNTYIKHQIIRDYMNGNKLVYYNEATGPVTSVKALPI